jgi:hypothetical protein
VPPNEILAKVKVSLPELNRVTLWAELVVSIPWLLKIRSEGGGGDVRLA